MEPLRLFLLAHPKSIACQALALALVRRFVDPPATAGLRIPTRLTPDLGSDLPPAWHGVDGINLSKARHTLVVLLSDARMVRTVSGGTGDQWRQFFQEGIGQTQATESPHYVLGIATDASGFGLATNEHMIRLSPECPPPTGNSDVDAQSVDEWVKMVVDDAALHITVRAIQKLEPRVVPTLGRAPLQLFLSHAKADLSSSEQDPIRFVENGVKELPIDYWFDAAEIPPSSSFEAEISRGISDCSIVVSFLTDHYSSRSWCQREVMDAKRLGVPVLVVDALDEGEPRHFPYIGNVPVVHWRSDDPKREARRVVSHAARETLRYIHNRTKLSQYAQAAAATVLATAPEALTLAHSRALKSHDSFIYPDPPLSEQELSVLRTLVPAATFTTPLSELAQSVRMDGRSVGVSISNSGDLRAHGLCEFHEQTLADEICLYLLLSGCRIAYGGSLTPQIQAASNFTLRLFEIVRGYSSLAHAATGRGLHPIVNYAPWPLCLTYDDQILSLFGNVATLSECTRPAEITDLDDALFPANENGKRNLAADTPERRLAWARGLTVMRTKMTQEVAARVAIGGRVDRFAGLYPGIFEEAWMSLLSERPLFLSGAFGGATDALIQAIASSQPDPILQSIQSDEYDECVALAVARGFKTVDVSDSLARVRESQTLVLGGRIAADFSIVRQKGIAASLKNGLSDDENLQLFDSSEPAEIVNLILTGLSRLPQPLS